MELLKKILSVLTLIVLLGSDILTSFSYALNDFIENSEIIYVEDGNYGEVETTERDDLEEESIDDEKISEDLGTDEDVEENFQRDECENDDENTTENIEDKDTGLNVDNIGDTGDDKDMEVDEEKVDGESLDETLITDDNRKNLDRDLLISGDSKGLSEENQEDQGLLGGLWDTLKSFFLEDEGGYLRGSQTVNDIVLSVEAEEGTFPEGTEVVIKGVPQKRLESIQTSLIEDESNKVREDTQILAFDISFVHSGVEIQPEKEVSLKFNYKKNADFQGASASQLNVYHIDDETDEGEEVEVISKDGDEIEVLVTDFSVYVLTLSDNNSITLTLDPGDGTIITGNNIVVDEYGIGTITSIDGNVTLPNITRENYVFAGWYTSQTTSLQSFAGNGGDQYYVNSDITLYADWCSRGYVINTDKTACISAGNLKTIMDQNPNFTYGEIEILRPAGLTDADGPASIVIMDRNLGASSAGTDSSAYGYYYQFGNNWGFSGGTIGTIEKAVALVDLSLYTAKVNPYYSGNFVYGSNNASGSNNQDWAVVPNDNIWGGTSEEKFRQGPCPVGWHVPTVEEWKDVIDYWTVSGGMTKGKLNSGNISSFMSDLKLSLAGGIARSDHALGHVGSQGSYRTTQVVPVASKTSGGQSYILRIEANGGSVAQSGAYNRVNGQSVRCFKNIEEDEEHEYYTVTFKNRDGSILWSGEVLYGTTPVYTGTQPSRPSTEQVAYMFDGWYPGIGPVVLDVDYTAVYTETPRLYTVTLTGTPTGYGTLSPESLSKEYETVIVISGDKLTIGGTEVILTGNEGYEFQEWTGNCGQISKQFCDDFIVYSHSDPIEFTGGNNIVINSGNSEGYDLFSQTGYQKDFEISFDILNFNLTGSSKQATLLSVKNEDLENLWPGFAFRRYNSTSNLELTAKGGSPSSVSKIYTGSDVHSVKISRENGKLYIAINGGDKEEVSDYSNFTNHFDKPITIGSIYQSGGYDRYAKATLSNILIKTIDTTSCYTGNVYVVTGDCQMTARFTAVNEHEIIFMNDDGIELQRGYVPYGVVPVYTGSTPEKQMTAQYSYTFSGWTDGENEYASGNLPIVEGAKVYTATYSSTVNEYTVTVVSSDINSGTVSTEFITAEYGTGIILSGNTLEIGSTTVIATPSSGTAQYSYIFSGWISDCNENILTGNCVFTGIFDSYINSYDISTSVATGDEDKGYLSGLGNTGINLTGLYEYGTELIFIAIPKLGYVFDYWMNGNEVMSGTDLGDGKNKLEIVVDQIKNIIAFFKPAEDTPYTVEHYKQNLGQTGYDFDWSGTMYGTTNAPTTVTGASYEGFSLSGNLADYQTGINTDGSTIVRLYYDRNTYIVTWSMWEGHGDWTKIEENVPYGATPVFEWDGGENPHTPSRGRDVYTDDIKYDFIFTGWVKNGSVEIIKDLTTQMVTGNVTYTAQYDTGFRYYEIRYHPNEGTGIMVNNNLQLYTSGNLNPNTFTKTGYEFSGWWYQYGDGIDVFYEDGQEINLGIDNGIKSDAEWTDPLYLDLQAQWKPSTDVKVTVNYYLKNLDADNNILIDGKREYATGVEFTGTADSIVDSILSRYGTGIEGYEYSKSIVYGSDLGPDGEETGMTSILADGSRVIDMYYVPSIHQFTLNSELHSSTAGSSATSGYYYGAKVTLSGASNNDCFIWSGWATSGIILSDNTVNQTSFTMPSNDVEATASVKEKTYNIVFNGGDDVEGSMSDLIGVMCTADVTLNNNFTKIGHTFTGWATTSGGEIVYTSGQVVSGIIKNDGETVNLYALWDINKFNVNISVAAGDHGSLQGSGAGIYEFGETLVITAVPELGYLFDYWEVNESTQLPEGATTGENQLTIVVDQILNIVAHFKENVGIVTVNYYEMHTGGLYSGVANSTTFTGLVGFTGYATVNIPYGFHLDTERTTNTGIVISDNDAENVIDIYYARNQHEIILSYSGDFNQTYPFHVAFDPSFKPLYYYGEHVHINAIADTGYTVVGWTNSGGDNVVINESLIDFDMGDENISLTIEGTINKYKIDYYLDGGIHNPNQPDNKTGYTIEDGSIQIYDPIKTGYNFLGWTGGVISGEQLDHLTRDLVIPEGSLGDRKYFANWEPAEVNVTVNYYTKKIDAENNVLTGGVDEYMVGVVFTGLTDEVVNISEKYGTGIEGYEYTTVRVYGSDLGPDGEETGTTTILADGSRSIDIYYTPVKYNFTVVAGQNTTTSGTSTSTGYYYGATVILSGTSTDDCFEWDKWLSNGTLLESIEKESHTGFAMPSHDVTVESKVTEKVYNIVFDENGGEGMMPILSVQCTTGILSPNNFEKAGYTFTGWSRNSEGPVEFTGETDVHRLTTESGGSVTLYAIWDVDWYTVTFNLNGGELTGDMTETKNYTIDTPIISLDNYIPIKSGYSLMGRYNGDILVNHIAGGETGDYTLDAHWKADSNTLYSVEYYKENLNGGYDVWTGTYTGETNIEVTALVKGFTGFTYSGGNENNIVTGVIAGDGSLVLKLYYDRNKYTITWKDGNNETLKREQLFYEEIPEYTGATPTKTATAQYTYTFNETWSPNIESVTTGVTYTAQFEETVNSYTINIIPNDTDFGIISTGEIYVEYGATIVENGNKITIGGVEIEATPNPADTQYTYEFDNWTNSCGLELVGTCTIQANFKRILNKYTITWLDEDGSLIDTTLVEYGVLPTHTTPTKTADDEYIYKFSGWTPEVVSVTRDATYTATYTPEKKEKPSGGGGMSGGGGRGNNIDSDNQHGSAEDNQDGSVNSGYYTIDDPNEDIVPLYKWTYENKITTMNTLEDANPDGLVTRGHLAKMVVNYMVNILGRSIPYDVTYNCVHWGDDESAWESDEIRDYAIKACAFGVMGINMENNEFLPNNLVTRAEFGTVISRMLWGDRYNTEDTDNRLYYEDHLQALKKKDILTQINNPEARWEIRKWVWLVFRRILEKKK